MQMYWFRMFFWCFLFPKLIVFSTFLLYFVGSNCKFKSKWVMNWMIKWLIDGGHVLEGTSGSEEHGVAKCAPESFGLSIWNFSSEYTVLHILYGAKMGTRELFAPSRFYIDNKYPKRKTDSEMSHNQLRWRVKGRHNVHNLSAKSW